MENKASMSFFPLMDPKIACKNKTKPRFVE